ncbi:MAG: TetR/AcrR family transcriptional regulator [Polyangiaceae bacterium]|nr:TetR/AcrR family transcriptional regulator [Polyangiaceae bacterium]
MARPKSDIEPRIIAAAHDMFLAEGVDSASLRAIARNAGTNIGMVYYYFPTKDDLFMAVVEDVYDGLLKRLAEALDTQFPVEERLYRAFSLIGKLEAYELEVGRIVVREMMTSTERRARLLERFQRGHLPLIVSTMLQGLQEQKFDPKLPLPVIMTSAIAVGALPQFILRVLGERLPGFDAMSQDTDLARMLVRVLFEGTGGPNSPPTHALQPPKGDAT